MMKATGLFLNMFMVFSRIPVSFVFDIFTNELISRNVYFFAHGQMLCIMDALN